MTFVRTLPLLLLAMPTLLAAADFDRSHALFAKVLKAHVRDGLVDYSALKASRRTLDDYVAALGTLDPKTLEGWKREDRFAYWINAYNAFTLRAVVDHYPIEGSWFSLYPRKSIRQISGVWDKLQFMAAGAPVTLDDIEHQILRKQFADPRLHAAINCASMSCPELRDEPYTGEKLDAQLTDAARRFAGSPARNAFDPAARTLSASSIFDWFAADFLAAYVPGGSFGGFTGKRAAAAAFFARFGPAGASKALGAGGFTVGFLSYDWTLNDTAP